ncbi:hypothetical protein [Bacteroides sp. 519]|uniref:hypothetical protein n=1 Tax=Bacteroides sp. 519 TaxID=2302937 RepID=UPI0013D3CC02|nr:hypothetical protein [Bacteroides sp. 519]NDV60460.1 hypothetical protein [Bacteroides sp. 519]
MKKTTLLLFLSTITILMHGQQIRMEATASLQQVYGTEIESETLLPMNDLDVEFGYVLYQTEITIEETEVLLEVENVRDYAVVYLNDMLQGTLTDNRKRINLPASPGTYTLRLYVENIGRITYGPEILDNSKGIFGNISLDGEDIGNWRITELNIRNCSFDDLVFSDQKENLPVFHKGSFEVDVPEDTYLDISGWGMGEVWINGNYIGSYWEEEKQQSIQVPASILAKGKNEVIVFELKNNDQDSMQLSSEPVFK